MYKKFYLVYINYFFLYILFVGKFSLVSNEKNIPTIIKVGETHKIMSQKKWKSEIEISYLWSKPQGPNNHKSTWVINDESVLFTPGIPGEYILSLSVETTTGQILGNEQFFLLAIIDKPEKADKHISKESPTLQTEQQIVLNNNQYSKGYSIQVSSWESENLAQKQKNKLIESGFNNTYIIKKYVDKKGLIKWRVRIGPYRSLSKTTELSKKLKILGYENFISEVRFKN